MSLWKAFKNLLKKILPPPTQSVMRETNSIKKRIAALQKKTEKQTAQLTKEIRSQKKLEQQHLAKLEELDARIDRLYDLFASANRENLRIYFDARAERDELAKRIDAQQESLTALTENAQKNAENSTRLAAEIRGIKDAQAKAGELLTQARFFSAEGWRRSSETMWAEVYNTTLKESDWLKDRSFSPGRFAVGYQYLYVMYRVLSEIRPKRILDLGLGQTTRMISQYAAAHDDVEHVIVEHDPNWIAFFQNDFQLSERSRIVPLELAMTPYKDAQEVRTYAGFEDTFRGQVFDFISIDAPFGSDMKEYARIDVLRMLPDCLSDGFVILIDDSQRIGERNMIGEVERVLSENGIEYAKGGYSGANDMTVICAKKHAFLATL